MPNLLNGPFSQQDNSELGVSSKVWFSPVKNKKFNERLAGPLILFVTKNCLFAIGYHKVKDKKGPALYKWML